VTEVRSNPCSACPYRCDVPSGVWEHHEYEKLREYDNITPDQPFAPFMCHATPEHLCSGWAVVHTSRGHEFDLLALRMIGYPDIPVPTVALFPSGNEAADHGQAEIEAPSTEALEAVDRLLRKYPRLQS
jgi:Family of unknown function (DUF6283)